MKGRSVQLPYTLSNIEACRALLLLGLAVNNHWTGPVDWTGGLDYWTDLWYGAGNRKPRP